MTSPLPYPAALRPRAFPGVKGLRDAPTCPARISRSQGRHNPTTALPRGIATARRVSRGNGKDEVCSLSIQLLAVVFPGVMETRGRAAHGGTGVCGSK